MVPGSSFGSASFRELILTTQVCPRDNNKATSLTSSQGPEFIDRRSSADSEIEARHQRGASAAQ